LAAAGNLRQGNNYVDAGIRQKMAKRTDWDELLESTTLPAQGSIN
jgi:hypothetical protein